MNKEYRYSLEFLCIVVYDNGRYLGLCRFVITAFAHTCGPVISQRRFVKRHFLFAFATFCMLINCKRRINCNGYYYYCYCAYTAECFKSKKGQNVYTL